MSASSYIGRFAPTPSGPLHFGSLVTALASWLDARAAQGRWYVRIEDIDPPREQPGAADHILRTLEGFGLTWDGPVLYQHNRGEAYQAALDQLLAQHDAFACSCSRKTLAGHSVYPGYCHHGPQHPEQPLAIRLKVDPSVWVCWQDRLQGYQRHCLGHYGDVVIRRKDKLWAYQLAVVVDDAAQGITDIVRGLDLLVSTPWQQWLQHGLQQPQPRYAHLPLVLAPNGQKLSKQNHAPAIDPQQAFPLLWQALNMLGQPLPDQTPCHIEDLLSYAVDHWDPTPLVGLQRLSGGDASSSTSTHSR
ncbi:tRNA glutamyl-Q(34) synthetase GluQRS [Terasakiispira papahanaumokuakeensis]|uniref:Glutamyl-Q tRNA(Asp) synthetase n=1 Tax=Terasakiispira papahanaumokuakeensis TaxID=197479 RepID=A0A1E2VCK2_9GAMM|nr:tRNA glutamyl-Q(34) synthetase GluQRS [Terasakiispira papahanaumokuakeensis]ODC04683.1 tRNA glutamyl-Q(34) synthetase GluQRS [Terasakiispira papahanaumokuakeensis]